MRRIIQWRSVGDLTTWFAKTAYLSLIANPAALSALRTCLQDADAEVREIAQEALAN